MTATKLLSEVPGFNPGWQLFVEGQLITGDWKVVSPRFGEVGTAVVMKPDGTPGFDRPYYRQAPYGQTIVYGRGVDGKTRLGLIVQDRPHSDAPGVENYDKPNSPAFFLTCPMGFMDGVRDKIETAMAGARREATEEVGKAVVLSEWEHSTGVNSSPSFETTWGVICALEVDIESVIPADFDPSEPIASHHWLTIKEFFQVVAEGEFMTASGQVAYPCFGTANAAIFAFLCAHPHIMAEAFAA